MQSLASFLLLLPLLNATCQQRQAAASEAGALPAAHGSSGESGRDGYGVLDSLSFESMGARFDLVILRSVQEEDPDTRSRWEGVRPLILYRHGASGERELIARNDSAVLCLTCGGLFGDPYTGVEFSRDTLVLHHYGGSNWRWVITHAFVQGATGEWPLVYRKDLSYSVFEPDSTRVVKQESSIMRTTIGSFSAYWK